MAIINVVNKFSNSYHQNVSSCYLVHRLFLPFVMALGYKIFISLGLSLVLFSVCEGQSTPPPSKDATTWDPWAPCEVLINLNHEKVMASTMT